MLVPFYDYDFGPAFRSPEVSGIVSLQPPVVRQTLPTLVPRVDEDGNELAGVRSVLLQAPLGTYTGWNPIAERLLEGPDPAAWRRLHPIRPDQGRTSAVRRSPASLEERYASHDGYVAQVAHGSQATRRRGVPVAGRRRSADRQAENSRVLR